ncbi:MAG: DUF2497 domain-containing protein [Pseudomonadota bacterium]|nr:DUF2497 domain-containing protein [Pseudomonadota bacterium]
MSDTEQEPSMEEILASIRRIISDDDKEMEAAAQENEEAPEDEEELAVEEMVAMAEPEPEPEPESEPEPVAEEVDDDDDDILDLTDMEAPDPEPLFEEQAYKEPEPEPIAPPVSPSPAPPPAPTPAPDNLVSPPQAGEASGSFERLTEKLNEDYSELPIGNGAVTLEGLTRELVRPMLKEWLDQHLPMTVERLVREEIERLVMQSQRRDPW